MTRAIRPALVVAAALHVGCAGAIGDPMGESSDPSRANPRGPDNASSPAANAPRPGDPPPPPAAGCSNAAPLRVPLRRLNRLEYDNTVRDLFGDTSRPSRRFVSPDDEASSFDQWGFDNNGDALQVNAQFVGDVRRAADALAGNAVAAGSKIMTCAPSAGLTSADCAKQILAPLARRAWRRAVVPQEVEALVAIVKNAEADGDTFTKGLELAIRKVLISPHFVFHIETVPNPTSAQPQALDGFALASRLSYFLWRSMPDDELLAVAESGRLSGAQELASQVTRMLADPKAAAMIDDLARQWLLGAQVEDAVPDATVYRSFDKTLRTEFVRETASLLGELVKSNLGVLGLLDADFTFVNDRLAKHYGIAGVTGSAFQKVSTATNDRRGGLLTQATIHLGTMTAPTMTSVENRGAHIVRRLLCMELEPPDNVDDAQKGVVAQLGPNPSKRAISSARNALPACGGCHSLLDPVGFGLENYNLVGVWRTTDETKHPVEARGELPGLGAFNGPKELSAALKRDPRLKACVAEVLTTFALARTLQDADHCAVAATLESTAPTYATRDLLRALVLSTAFRFQSGEASR